MSAVVMIGLVSSYHLINLIMFNGRVISEKASTISILKSNNENIEELKSQIKALDTNENLASVKAQPDDQSLQVILDALPASANSLSFGASLQEKLLVGPSGLVIKSISVDPSQTEEVDEYIDTKNTSESKDAEGKSEGEIKSSEVTASSIGFTFTVEGSEQALQEALEQLEKSIRTVYIDSLAIQRQGGQNEMTVMGHVFYQVEKTADLKKKVVK